MYQIAINSLAVLLALAANLQPGSCHEFSLFDDYLQLAKEEAMKGDLHKTVRDAMLKLEVTSESSPKQIMGQIMNAEATDATAEVYSILATLKNSSDRCQPYLIDVLKSLLAQMKADSKGELSKFGNFMHETVSDKLKRCADRSESETMENPDIAAVRLLDSFFIEAFTDLEDLSDKGNVSPDTIVDKLTKLSLFDDELNFKRMAKYAGEHHRANFHRVAFTDLRLVEGFLDSNCNRIMSFSNLMNIINLAQAVGDWRISSAQVKRLNEYFRMCSVWREPEMHDMIKLNFEQMERTQTA